MDVVETNHGRWIAAPPAAVWAALEHVSMADLTLTRWLMAVRHLGRSGSAPRRPLLTHGPVTLFSDDGHGLAVAGMIGRPWRLRPERRPVAGLAELEAFAEPGWVTVVTDFRLSDVNPAGVRLNTTTSVRATDDRARRRFAAYWRLIGPFSGVVRRDVLRAVDRLATSA